jgi:hypothetical protein
MGPVHPVARVIAPPASASTRRIDPEAHRCTDNELMGSRDHITTCSVSPPPVCSQPCFCPYTSMISLAAFEATEEGSHHLE